MTISRRWAIALFAILVVSLGLNLTVAGFMASRVMGGGPRPPPIGGIVAIGIRSFPPEIQKVIREKSEERRAEIGERLEGVRAARQKMFEVLRADPFDPAALDSAFTELRNRTTELQLIGQEMVAEAVADAPADVRAEIRPPKRGERRGSSAHGNRPLPPDTGSAQ